ncbi:MAG: 4-hydroxy-tetrahydrodipicolinate reductase [Bacteroidota bacterium]
MRIGLIGYGKMGKAIEAIALERGHQISWKVSSENPLNLQDFSLVDCVIEFTKPQIAVENIKKSLNQDTPIIVGTTGWNDYLNEVSEICNDLNGTLLYASNFSVGVNIFFQINERLAQLMSKQTEYTAKLEEIHHVQKIDSPSGTAITLANGILENNDSYMSWVCGENEDPYVNENQLGVTAYRVPNVPGKHSVEYKSEVDSIKITHEAFNRDGFALGAVLAAEWSIGKKGVFTMKDVLGI